MSDGTDKTEVELEPRMLSSNKKAQAFFMGELDENDREVWVWLPLSQIEVEPLKQGSKTVTVTLPEWLAINKELV